jgi:NADPH2:quinone reductase
VVFDCIGGDYAEAALRGIAWEGRFLVIGFTAGITRLPLNLTLLKGCQVVGVFYGAMVQRDPALRAEIDRELDALAAAGKLHPFVSARYPLAEAGEALRALLDRKVIGKVVVEPHR